MRIKSDYETRTKEDLLAEANLRGLDVSTSTLKADIIAALQLSDEPKVDQPPAPLPPLKASLIPHVEAIPTIETGLDACTPPSDDEFTDGLHTLDGELYALCVHDPDGYGNTHTLKNNIHFWQGKEVDFNATFKRA